MLGGYNIFYYKSGVVRHNKIKQQPTNYKNTFIYSLYWHTTITNITSSAAYTIHNYGFDLSVVEGKCYYRNPLTVKNSLPTD